MDTQLGRLEPVDVHMAWQTEDGDFTNWLAEDQNLVLLGDALGLDLECEGTEQGVGSFRADILCKDTADGSWVLIENQLERTDHDHLGKLMTYAAGLEAVTVVWIARRFTDEHRAALDWLNEITADPYSFFGLEIELWRIGNSALAPKLNIVSKPNNWRPRPGPGKLTVSQQLWLEYWTAFMEVLKADPGPLRPRKPLPQHWQNFAVGRLGFSLDAHIIARDRRIGVLLVTEGPDAKAHFHLLHAQKEAIEGELGYPLEWLEQPDKKLSYTRLQKMNTEVEDRSDWPAQHEWLLRVLKEFHRVFAPRIKQLDATEYTSAEGATPSVDDYGTYPNDDQFFVTVSIPPSIDGCVENQDWPKGTWDLLDIDNVDKLRSWLAASHETAEHFKTLPVYYLNVDKMPWLKEL